MNLLMPLQHGNKVRNLAGASLGLLHGLNSPRNRIQWLGWAGFFFA